MPILPAPLRAYIGLVATAVETAQGLIQRAPELPVEAVGNTMQLSMKVQQRYQELVARGDELLSHLIGPPAQSPGWATFDEDEQAAGGAHNRSAASGGTADASTVDDDDMTFDDAAGSNFAPAAFAVDSAGETVVDASATDLFDDDLGGGAISDDPVPAAVFDDDPVPAAVFDDDPVAAAIFDDEAKASPTVTHGDPLLAQTPVLTLPTKKPGRRTTGGPRRRLAPAPAVLADPAVLGSTAVFTAGEDAGGGTADAEQLTGPGNPAPANVDTMEAIPVEAVMAELADATPATPVPPARKTAARRPAPARRAPRPRPGGGTSDGGSPASGTADAGEPLTGGPAVQQPAEPTAGVSDSDAAPMS